MVNANDLKFKATHGTAIYTGGGLYVVIGQLDNGLWFYGGTDFCDIFDEDTRTYDNENDGLACFWNDWCEKHRVELDARQTYAMYYDFCRRLDNNEPGLTDGYEEYSNYAAGEVVDYIDFSYFDAIETGVDFNEDKSESVKKVKEMADNLMELTQCGAIREYFDYESPDLVYESSTIFNFFSLCEDVAFYLSRGEYKAAEDLILNSYK